jgi:hypothetical protein
MIAANLDRICRYADGWLPMGGDPTPHLATLRGALVAAGRDVGTLAVNARLDLSSGDEGAWLAESDRLRSAGVTHLVLDPGPGRPARESAAIVRRAVEVVGPVATPT